MGGKTHSTNDQVVQQQKEEAAAAAAKEAQRQARLNTGLQRIRTAFGGKPVYNTVNQTYNWKNFKTSGPATDPNAAAPQGVPQGWTAVRVHAPTQDDVQLGGAAPVGAGQGQVWALKGPDGQIRYQGEQFMAPTQVQATDPTTGAPLKKGGFDDAFYNNYKQSILDYYMPQVDKQYSDAKNELTYRLARAGSLNSSAANTAAADLGTQYDTNQAGIRSQADTGAADLRTKVASEKQQAINQLYATEDPTLAANTASAAVRDIGLSQPNVSPLGQIFQVATVGAGNIMKGLNAYNTGQIYNNAFGSGSSGGGSGQRVVGT